MRVQFDATLNDMVDAGYRALSRSRTVQWWRWRGMIITGLFCGLIWGIPLFFLFAEPELKLLFGGVFSLLGAGFGILLYSPSYRRTIRRRLRQLYREQLGTNSTFVVQIELAPDGLYTTQMKTHTMFEWPEVEVEETADSIDFLIPNGGIVVVRKRAFTSSDEAAKFFEEAKRFCSQSRESYTANRGEGY